MLAIFNLPVLFFVFGIIAKLLKSNLELPEQLVKGIILYLMLAIGIKGGISLAEISLTTAALVPIGIVVAASFIVPLYVFYVVKRFETIQDAAGIAATYGSNSTMTFITAAAFLGTIDVVYGGYMTVALVLMETPAIIYSLYLVKRDDMGGTWSSLKASLLEGTHLLLIASLVIGTLTVSLTENTAPLLGFISGDIFSGAMCFFLLYMGLKVGDSLTTGIAGVLNYKLVLLAILLPWINGSLGFFVGTLFNMESGDLLLTTVLCASSSYIVAPAILSTTLPEADAGKYLSMSLGITFPINILVGIPVWWSIIN